SLLILFFLPRTPPLSPLFPYTTLFRSPDLVGCSCVHAGNRSGAQRDNSAWVKAPLCLLRSLCTQTYCNRKKGVWRRLRRAWKQAHQGRCEPCLAIGRNSSNGSRSSDQHNL